MARTISKRAWDKYSSKQARIRKEAAREIRDYVLGAGDDVELAAAVSKSVAVSYRWGRSSAALAAIWYDQHARAAGANVPKAEIEVNHNVARIRAIESQGADRCLKSGDVEGFAKACAIAVAGEVKRSACQTMLRNAARDGAEFAWIPHGDETCAFCMTLSSRGWTRASKAVADGEHADHIHDNCMCEFAVRFDSKTDVAGYQPEAYREMYQDAEGSSPRDKINSMRRDIYAENKDSINAQRRERYAERKAAEEG